MSRSSSKPPIRMPKIAATDYSLWTLMSFSTAFHHALPHGVLTAVTLPETPEEPGDRVLARLHHDERAFADTLNGHRRIEFIGGRLALRSACEQLGERTGAILPSPRGAPMLPDGLSGSISHKRGLAVGMACRSTGGTLGIDLEDYGPARPGIVSMVLRETERAAVTQLPDDVQWMSTLQRFSMKEAVYKALDPYVHRYVGFHEAEVIPELNGLATVTLHLKHGEGPFHVDARYTWLLGRLLCTVKIRPDA